MEAAAVAATITIFIIILIILGLTNMLSPAGNPQPQPTAGLLGKSSKTFWPQDVRELHCWSRRRAGLAASPAAAGEGGWSSSAAPCSSGGYKFDLLLHDVLQDLRIAVMESRRRQAGRYWGIRNWKGSQKGGGGRAGPTPHKPILKGTSQVKTIRIKYTSCLAEKSVAEL